MIRLGIYLTKKQKDAFEHEAKKTGLSVAELIRRALDEYLARKEKQ